MKTKSLSFRILLLISLILCFGFILTACNDSPNDQSETITLAETKELIVNALSLDNETSSQISSQANNGNRDVFLKFGTTDTYIRSNLVTPEYTDSVNMSATIEKTGDAWSKYALNYNVSNNSTNLSTQEYFDGNFIYKINFDDSKTKTEFSNGTEESANLSLILCNFDVMFLDEAFDVAYKNDVLKTSINDGYTLTIELSMYEYASYVMETVGPSTDGLFGTGESLEKLKDEGFGEIVITFDNNDNINSLDFSMQVFGGAGNEIYPNNVTISLDKSNSQVSEPDWFNQEDFE